MQKRELAALKRGFGGFMPVFCIFIQVLGERMVGLEGEMLV